MHRTHVHVPHSHVCSMPEHGSPTATAACCRPDAASRPEVAAMLSGPLPAPVVPLPRIGLRWWGDPASWRAAARNTFTCLIGCSIGDLGVLIYIQAFHPHLSMLVTMALAMTAGLVTSVLFETILLRRREGFPWRLALTTAFSMSFLSMLAMELVANLTDIMLTGGRVAVTEPYYWFALALSLGAGFLAPLPYNYYQLRRHGRTCH